MSILGLGGRSFSRDSNPRWWDWRCSLCGLGLVFSLLCCLLGNYESVLFACHATGLDAVQRLEKKKSGLCFLHFRCFRSRSTSCEYVGYSGIVKTMPTHTI